jgi:DegV family protein with EDD domain
VAPENPQSESRVAVIADTTTAVPDDLVQQLGIQIVPYYVNVGTQTLRDVFDLGREQFYRWIPSVSKLPTTANPGAGDYLAAFREAYARTLEMVVVTMTSMGSGAYQAATIAKELALQELPQAKIQVVDSRQVSMAHGWAVIEAARAALAGADLARVGSVARETALNAMMIQTADTLKYLYMGGRIGSALHLVGALLRVKPLIGMEDGEIVALGQARSRSGAYGKMVELMSKRVGRGGRIKVAYMHAHALEEALEIRARVSQAFDCVEEIITELSPALGVHTGPGTAGLAFVPVQ